MKSLGKQNLIRLLCALAAIALGVGILIWRQGKPAEPAELADDSYDVTVVPPTCTDQGYTIYENLRTGSSKTEDPVPALGHSFGAWETVTEQQGVEPGMQTHVCERCGTEESRLTFRDDSLAKLVITGSLDGIGKTSEVPVTVFFQSETEQFSDYAYLKHQGHASLLHEKKNFTLKLYTDEKRTDKDKRMFLSWRPEHKYILKANARDPSQVRNLLCANIWADIVAARDVVPERLQGLSNYGAVDGFPIALYLNNSFSGLYTFTLHKDDDLFAMSDDARDAIAIINYDTSDAAKFRAETDFDEDGDWELEFCGTEDPAWAQEKVNALIRFVNTSDDKTFRAELKDYMDVDAAVDYLLALYALGLTQNGTENLLLACYDDGVWIPSLFDLGVSFGLNADGRSYDERFDFLPKQVNGMWSSGTNSLLWDRVLQNFQPELCARYQSLRASVLKEQTIHQRIDAALSVIPTVYYEADAQQHPELPAYDDGTAAQMKADFTTRITKLDQIFGK